jgi:hypothetical protein
VQLKIIIFIPFDFYYFTTSYLQDGKKKKIIMLPMKFFKEKFVIICVLSYGLLLNVFDLNLNLILKQNLLTASANALKMCLHYPRTRILHQNLHKLSNRATPSMYCDYKSALQLYKLFNENTPQNEWIHLNLDIINTSRQQFFEIRLNYQLRIGKKALCNKLNHLNGKISLDWLNLPFESFKFKCKNKFLTFTN